MCVSNCVSEFVYRGRTKVLTENFQNSCNQLLVQIWVSSSISLIRSSHVAIKSILIFYGSSLQRELWGEKSTRFIVFLHSLSQVSLPPFFCYSLISKHTWVCLYSSEGSLSVSLSDSYCNPSVLCPTRYNCLSYAEGTEGRELSNINERCTRLSREMRRWKSRN